MDPVAMAYRITHPRGPAHRGGTCARCGLEGGITATTKVISPTFTDFDGWRHPGGPALCVACAWSYSRHLRMAPLVLTQGEQPTVQTLTIAGVGELLSVGPLLTSQTISVPLRPGRKYTVPHLRWGTIRIDNTNLTWSTGDAGRLAAIATLAGHGFTASALKEPVPRWEILRRITAADWPLVHQLWHQLDPWRASTSWLDLGLHLARGMVAAA